MKSFNEIKIEKEHNKIIARQNKILKYNLDIIAKANGVNVFYCNKTVFDFLMEKFNNEIVLDGILIYNGSLYFCDHYTKSIPLLFHELLHILSVPKEHRYYMKYDTEKSYKLIKKFHDDPKRILNESAVHGAQAILMKKFNIQSYVWGNFFNGWIHKDGYSDVDSEWLERGQLLLNQIKMEI